MRSSLYFYSFIIFYGIVSSSVFAMDARKESKISKAIEKALTAYSDPQQNSCKVSWHQQIVEAMHREDRGSTVGSASIGAPWRHHKNTETKDEAFTCNFGGIYVADCISRRENDPIYRVSMIKSPQIDYGSIFSAIAKTNNGRHSIKQQANKCVAEAIAIRRYDSVCCGYNSLVATAKQNRIEIYTRRHQDIKTVRWDDKEGNIADMIFLADSDPLTKQLTKQRLFALCERVEVDPDLPLETKVTRREVCAVLLVDNCNMSASFFDLFPTYLSDPMKIVQIKGNDGCIKKCISLIEYKMDGTQEQERLYAIDDKLSSLKPVELKFEMSGKQYSLARLRHFPEVHKCMLAQYNADRCFQFKIDNIYDQSTADIIKKLVGRIIDFERFKVSESAKDVVYDQELKVGWAKNELPELCAVTDMVPYYRPSLINDKGSMDLRRHFAILYDQTRMGTVMYNGKPLEIDRKPVSITPLGSLLSTCCPSDKAAHTVFKKPNYELGKKSIDNIFKKEHHRVVAIQKILKNQFYKNIAFKHGTLMGVAHDFYNREFLSIYDMKQENDDSPVSIDITGTDSVTSFITDENNNAACLCRVFTKNGCGQQIRYAHINDGFVQKSVFSITIPTGQEAIRLHSVSDSQLSYYLLPKGKWDTLKYLFYPMVRLFSGSNAKSYGEEKFTETRAMQTRIFDIRGIPSRIHDLWQMMRGRL